MYCRIHVLYILSDTRTVGYTYCRIHEHHMYILSETRTLFTVEYYIQSNSFILNTVGYTVAHTYTKNGRINVHFFGEIHFVILAVACLILYIVVHFDIADALPGRRHIQFVCV
jgi:hypothetical protein